MYINIYRRPQGGGARGGTCPGARRGGGQEGALAPPGNLKIWGLHKDNLMRKNFKNIY